MKNRLRSAQAAGKKNERKTKAAFIHRCSPGRRLNAAAFLRKGNDLRSGLSKRLRLFHTKRHGIADSQVEGSKAVSPTDAASQNFLQGKNSFESSGPFVNCSNARSLVSVRNKEKRYAS